MEPNFYEILEISIDAPAQSVERAYRIARATYQPASVATYSVFSEEENADILERIEEAYTVLSDDRLRREYDARLRRKATPDPVPQAAVPVFEAVPEPAFGPEFSAQPMSRSRRPSRPTEELSSIEIEFEHGEVPDDGAYDGQALRRVRISRGIEIEEISQVTKISEMYLQLIEANRYQDLPDDVYLRGFLREFAKFLKLDPRTVVDSYMAEALP